MMPFIREVRCLIRGHAILPLALIVALVIITGLWPHQHTGGFSDGNREVAAWLKQTPQQASTVDLSHRIPPR